MHHPGASINATTGVFTWTPTTAGSYTFKVRVTDNGAPLLYDEEQITVTVANALTSMTATQQEDATAAIHATLYPNPVDDKFYVTLSAPVEKLTIRIINISGEVMSSNTYQATGKNRIEVNASQLSRGIYMLQLTTEQSIQTLRFIKK